MGLFGVSEKQRQKIATKAASVSGTPQTDAVIGQRKFAMSPGAWIFVGVMVVTMIALAVTLEIIPIPGVLFLVIFLSMTKPRRLVTIGPGGYTNLAGSVWSTSPKKVIGSAPSLQFLSEKDVVVGDETLTLAKKEMDHLRSRMTSGMMADSGGPPPPPGSPPFQASTLGVQNHGSVPSQAQSFPSYPEPIQEQAQHQPPNP